MSKDIGGRRRMGCRIAFFQLFEHLFLSRPQDRDQQRRIVQDQRAGHRDTELMGFGMLGNGVITAVRQQRQGIRKNGRSMRITSDTQDDAIKIGQLPVPGHTLSRHANNASLPYQVPLLHECGAHDRRVYAAA